MDTKHVVRITGTITVAGMLLMLLIMEFMLKTNGRLWDMTLTAVHLDAVVIIVQLVMWRTRTLRDIYTMGYRHGRHDANHSLLESGFWLSEEAERDAQRNIGE